MWNTIEKDLVAQNRDHALKLRPAQFGRGQTFDTRVRKGLPPPRHLRPSRKGDVQPQYEGSHAQHSQWFRQLRRIQAYSRFKKVHHLELDNASAHGTSLWRGILCAKGFAGGFPSWWEHHCNTRLCGAPGILPLVPPSHEVAELIYGSLVCEVRALEAKLRSALQTKLRSQRAEMAHLVFRDCQAAQPDKVDILLQHRQSQVVEVNHDEQFVRIEPAIRFEHDKTCFIAGQEAWILNADPDIIHLDDVDNIQPGQTIVQAPVTGTLDDLFKAFGDEWSARWNRHADVLPSQWDQIIAFCQHHLPSKHLEPRPITSECIRSELRRKKHRSATGPDGVSLRDLRAMPEPVLEAHASLFQRAETDGQWPEQALVGRVAALAKTANPSLVRDFRPITVLSHCYRLWGGIRSRQLLRHVDSLCPSFLRGNRPGCHAMQLWTFVQWMIELSYHENRPLAGISADIQKAFNHIPREVMLNACLLLGIPSSILKAWAGALANIQRRFHIREAMSPPHFSVTGCPEGCSMSCLGMLVIDIIFHKWISVQFPLEYPLSYVDDWQILSFQPDRVAAILHALENFTTHVDLQLDAKKTFAWCTCQNNRKALKQQGILVQDQAKSLGAQMQFTRRHAAKVLTARLETLKELWPKLRRSLSPYKVKVRAIVAAAWPRGLHGVAATSVSLSQLGTARSGAMKALSMNGAGCSSLIHLGMIESPMTDPHFWTIMETLRSIRDSHSFVALAPLIQTALEVPSPLPRGGPTRALVDRMHFLGWHIDEHTNIHDDLGPFDLFKVSPSELYFRVERSWIRVVASGVSHRPIFQGLHRVNSRATRKFLHSLPDQDQGIFRKSLNGAHFTNDALCYFNATGSSKCSFCNQEDSRFHRYWECPIFETHRSTCPSDIRDIVPQLPSCLTLAGWSIYPESLDEWNRMLLAIPEPDSAVLPPNLSLGTWVDVFSDGSCFWPDSAGYNIASWAIAFAPPELQTCSSTVLAAGPLPGLLQTAFRAEVFAALQVIRFGREHGVKVRLWTDCLGVVNRLHKILRQQPVKPSTPNADLWIAISEELTRLGHDSFIVTKVAAHQSIDDAEGPVEQWAFLHNSLVDRAARLANMCRDQDFWSLHSRYAEECEAIARVVKHVQQVILNIGRQAVEHDTLLEDGDEIEVTPTVPKRSREVDTPPDYRLSLPDALPSAVTAKFGFRQTALVFSWLRQALEQSSDQDPTWISFYQLYVDFQCATGDTGPIYADGWVDPFYRPNVLMTLANFRKRCTWFTKLVKHVARVGGSHLHLATIRPTSVSIQLHAPGIWIRWPSNRLTWVEEWFSKHLSQAATRNGGSLKALPLAKRDERWPMVNPLKKPLRF